jgi:hypothetical protein
VTNVENVTMNKVIFEGSQSQESQTQKSINKYLIFQRLRGQCLGSLKKSNRNFQNLKYVCMKTKQEFFFIDKIIFESS